MRCVFRVAGDDYAGMMSCLIPDERQLGRGWDGRVKDWMFTIVADASLSRQRLAKVKEWVITHAYRDEKY